MLLNMDKYSKSLTLDFMADGLLVNYYYYEIAHIAMKSRCVGFPTMLIKKSCIHVDSNRKTKQ